MRCHAPRLLCRLILAAGTASAGIPQAVASPARDVEIKLPAGIASETIFIRYRLPDEDLGGWVQPRPGVSSYLINTTDESHPAGRLKALIYAPGCALQALDVPLSGPRHQEYAFTCRPLPNVWISGKLTRLDRLYGREVRIGAKYVALWAQPFLGLRDDIAIDIPVGDAVDLEADGHFRMLVPDFSHDGLAGAPDHPGALQIWARDKTSGGLVGLLMPELRGTKTPIGGVTIRPEYFPEIIFAPCTETPPPVHNAFALRPAPIDACGP